MNVATMTELELWKQYQARWIELSDESPDGNIAKQSPAHRACTILDSMIADEMDRTKQKKPATTMPEALRRIGRHPAGARVLAAVLDPRGADDATIASLTATPEPTKKARPPTMATRAEKIEKDGATARDLIGNEAATLMAADSSLTVEQARVQARKTLPDIVRKAEREAGPITETTAHVETVETLADRIERAVDKAAGQLSTMPGKGANGRDFYHMRRNELRNEIRHRHEFIAVRKLLRGPQGQRPADSMRKSAEHAEALETIDRWLAL